MNITGIVIPANPEQVARKVEFDQGDVAAMQSLVGGTFAVLNLAEMRTSLWFYDEARLFDRPRNYRASVVLWFYRPAFSNAGEYLYGDVLVTGLPDSAGRTVDAPADLVRLVLETRNYRVTYRDKRTGETSELDTKPTDVWSAYEIAHYLAKYMFGQAENIRIEPA